MKNNKGFTLAELLIVVAVIAVLVGISIPFFTAQLEKARDATSIANLRAAYAEASVAYITRESTGNAVFEDFEGIAVEGEDATSIKVSGVVLAGKKSNNFSGNIESLPFRLFDTNVSDFSEPAEGIYMIMFDFDNVSDLRDDSNKIVALAILEN